MAPGTRSPARIEAGELCGATKPGLAGPKAASKAASNAAT